MVNVEYAQSFVEVLDIIKHMDENLMKKIPNKVIEFLENNSSDNTVNIDYSKSLNDMQLNSKTYAILSILYMNYICSPEEKTECVGILQKNEVAYQKSLQEKYSYENLFNHTEVQAENKQEQTNQLVEYKKPNLFSRLIEKIKSFFNIRK